MSEGAGMPKTVSAARQSGIYECSRCGSRKTVNRGRKFPPCNDDGAVNWELVEATTKAPKRKGKKGGILDFLFG